MDIVTDTCADTAHRTRGSRERARIVVVATRILNQTPYRCFTLDDVATACRLPSTVVQEHFADADALYRVCQLDRIASPRWTVIAHREDVEPPVVSLGRFAERAFAVLGTPQHRNLWCAVVRDVPDIPWIGELYNEYIEEPLARRFQDLALAASGMECSTSDLHRLSRMFIATIRASALSSDPDGRMTASEIASLMLQSIEASSRGRRRRPFTTVVERRARPARGKVVPSSSPDYPPLSVPAMERENEVHRPMVKRGALTVTFDPTEIRWNGIVIALSGLEADLMSTLVRKERLPSEIIDNLLIRRNASIATRDVLIYRIRRKFADVGAADPIETIRGWGLRMRVERDASGSKALMIGALEPRSQAGVPI